MSGSEDVRMGIKLPFQSCSSSCESCGTHLTRSLTMKPKLNDDVRFPEAQSSLAAIDKVATQIGLQGVPFFL